MADDELDEAEGVMPWEDGYVDPAADEAAEPELFTAEQVAAARAEARAEADEAAEAKVRGRQSSFDQREAARQKALSARGLAFTADDDVAVLDPRTAVQLLMGAPPIGGATPQADDEPEIIPYDADSIKRYHDWRDAKRERELDERMDAKYGARVAALDDAQGQQARPVAQQATRAALEELGLQGLEDTPEFKAAFEGFFKQMTNSQRLDGAYVQGVAALVTMGMTTTEQRATIRQQAKQRGEETKAQAERDRQREAMMAQGGAPGTRSVSMGGSGAYAGGGGDQAAFDAQILSELSNEPEFDRDLLRAVSAPALKDGRSAVQALQERRAKANGAR